jgi:voltage-dependent calcium channel T type alpha-1G
MKLSMKGMRILVMLLLDTLPMLGNVLLLCFFVFFIFGIIGVQLWKGVLRNRCFLDYNNSEVKEFIDMFSMSFYKPEFSDSYICSEVGGSGMTTCNDIPPYVNNSRICNGTLDLLKSRATSAIASPSSNVYSTYANDTACINWNSYFTKCRPSDKNPFKGAISFDNIGYAWVAIFQVGYNYYIDYI